MIKYNVSDKTLVALLVMFLIAKKLRYIENKIWKNHV